MRPDLRASLGLFWLLVAAVPAPFEAQGHSGPLLAPMFSDHAVLQRDQPIRIWGTSAANDEITIRIAALSAAARADASGSWEVTLPTLPAGGPHTLEVRTRSGRTQRVSDILTGDVWLCSGQSNMEMPVAGTQNADFETARSANARIRLLTIARASAPAPLDSFQSSVTWDAATPATVRPFSATCYYFARQLQKSVDVPMGLIHASWSGSRIEPWLPEAILRASDGFGEQLDLLGAYAGDAAAGTRRLGEAWGTWWMSRRPSDGEPWRATSEPAGTWRDVPEPLRDWKTWGVKELANHNGMVWFRRVVNLTASQAAQAATLSLGGIDEVDQTWVNGQPVGNTFGWGTPRTYSIPPGVLNAGGNVIVVNVLSTWDAGGMFGPPARQSLRFADGTETPLGGGWRYQPVLSEAGSPPRAPWESVGGLTTLYNAMIAPLGRYGIRGVAWYQGESNAGNARSYEGLLTGLMSGWRGQFGDSIAFLIVQLPGFGAQRAEPMESGWAGVRDAQRRAVAADRRAGLAVTIDLGQPRELHPPNKVEVGVRLARVARRVVYGERIAPSGPVATGVHRDGAGRLVVSFSEVEGALVALSGAPIAFEACGAMARSCRFVNASIDGDRVRLEMADASISRVRYCWGDSPVCNLTDRSGLPAGPFELSVR